MILVAAALALFRSVSAPIPRVWISPSGAYALSIAPPTEKVKEARLRLFTVDADDRERTLWRARLPYVPRRLEVSDDGHAAAVGTYPFPTDGDKVVIFGDQGQILARHEVRTLLTPEEIAGARRSPFGDVFWQQNAYWPSIRNQLNAPKGLALPPILRNVGEARGIRNDFPVAFSVVIHTGQEIWFDLTDGKAHRLPPYQAG